MVLDQHASRFEFINLCFVMTWFPVASMTIKYLLYNVIINHYKKKDFNRKKHLVRQRVFFSIIYLELRQRSMTQLRKKSSLVKRRLSTIYQQSHHFLLGRIKKRGSFFFFTLDACECLLELMRARICL